MGAGIASPQSEKNILAIKGERSWSNTKGKMKARDSTKQRHSHLSVSIIGSYGIGIGEEGEKGEQKGLPFQMHSTTLLGKGECQWVWDMLYPCYC